MFDIHTDIKTEYDAFKLYKYEKWDRILAFLIEYYYTNDGILISMDHGVPSNTKQTSLLYNEYIDYDTDQINMKYLLRVDFQYKY